MWNGMYVGPRLCSKPGGVGDMGLAAGRLQFLEAGACSGLVGRRASDTCTVYTLESACVKIVWQREFLLQEVKV
jgi:hypothetical protein